MECTLCSRIDAFLLMALQTCWVRWRWSRLSRLDPRFHGLEVHEAVHMEAFPSLRDVRLRDLHCAYGRWTTTLSFPHELLQRLVSPAGSTFLLVAAAMLPSDSSPVVSQPSPASQTPSGQPACIRSCAASIIACMAVGFTQNE